MGEEEGEGKGKDMVPGGRACARSLVLRVFLSLLQAGILR